MLFQVGQDFFPHSTGFLGIIQEVSLGQQIYIQVFLSKQILYISAFTCLSRSKEKTAF